MNRQVPLAVYALLSLIIGLLMGMVVGLWIFNPSY